MDMRMPVMDGYEATRRIKAMPGGEECVIVSVTASVFEDGRARMLDAGCDAILRKPYKDVDVFALLENLLGLQFVRENAAVANVHTGIKRVLQPKDLDPVPGEWRTRFIEKTMLGNVSEMRRLLDELEVRHPQVAFGMAGLIERFQFERILQLLCVNPENSPKR
jgi:CheY-like chemotaxis protein